MAWKWQQNQGAQPLQQQQWQNQAAQQAPRIWTPGGGQLQGTQAQAVPDWQRAQPQLLQPGGVRLQAQMQGAAQTAASASVNYVVACQGPDAEELVVKTLVGEFAEHSTNHSRKVYKKMTQPGSGVEVYLYYWDGRDGPAFQGWWFGNQVGGTQVWSHNPNESAAPPAAGWKIPWDGQVRPNLSVSPKPQGPDYTKEVQEAVQNANASLLQVRAAGASTDAEAFMQAEQLLTTQVAELSSVMQTVTTGVRGLPPDRMKQVTQSLNQVRAAQQSVNAELAKIRAAKAKAEHFGKQKELEVQDLANFQTVQQQAEEKVHAAEDSAEKALITAEMIKAAGEDMSEMKVAVSETEKAVLDATKSLGEARILVNSKLALVRRYQSEVAKNHAIGELTKLQAQLQAAQNKLAPVKNAKQDFVQRQAAQKVAAEVLALLTPAELEVDRSEEAFAVLNTGETPTPEQVRVADAAIETAATSLAGAQKFLDAKKRVATQPGPLQGELAKLDERLKVANDRIAEIKNKRKESQERSNFEVIMTDASEKVKTATEAVNKAMDSEAPFLTGMEGLPIAETMAAVKACETSSAAANSSVSIARMFLATKLVESKRFAKGISEEAQTRLKEQQALLEVSIKRLGDLKANTAARKSKAAMVEAERIVVTAEEAAKKVAEVAAVFANDEELFALSSAKIKEAGETTTKAEIDANKSLGEARKYITARQIESKHKEASGEVSADLIKFQTRLSAAQTEVGKYKRLAASAETRLASKRTVEEAEARVKTGEAKVDAVAELLAKMSADAAAPAQDGDAKDSKEETAAKATKAVEAEATKASVALRSALKFCEMQAKKDGACKEELAKLKPRLEAAQKRLEAETATVKERAEKMTVDLMLAESEDRVKTSEEAVAKVQEAEAALTGAAELPAEEAGKLLSDLEAAVHTATSAVGAAKTFLAMKRLASKRLGEAYKENAVSTLAALQERLDKVATVLSDTKKGMAERRASTIRRQVATALQDLDEKVAAAEEATKALAETAEATEEATADSMKVGCEKAGTALSAAQSALENAKNLLLTRQRDAKSTTSEANTAILEEISKHIDQVTKHQGALDKQKALLSEKEHRFVSNRLLKEANELVAKVEAKLEATTATAEPLASESLEAFAGIIFLTSIFDLFAQHAKATGVSREEIFKQAADGGASVDAAKFVAYTTRLLEREENKEQVVSEEQQRNAFARLCGDGKTEATEADFMENFRRRYVVNEKVSMTDKLEVKGAKATRKLEAGEIVEMLEEPTKEQNAGVLRMRARVEKDSKEGYVTIEGNQGTVYLSHYSGVKAAQKDIEKALSEATAEAKEAMKFIDSKADELKAIRAGPLAETKGDLLKLRPKISKVQTALGDLKKKVSSADRKLVDLLGAEKKKRQEAADKQVADEALKEVTKALGELQALTDKAIPDAEAICKGGKEEDGENSDPVASITKVEKDLSEAIVAGEAAAAVIKGKLEGLKPSTKGPLGDLRSLLVKHKVSVGTLDTKCKKQLTALRSSRKQASTEAHAALMDVIRADAVAKSVSAEDLFEKLKGAGGDSVSVEKLREHAATLPGCPKAGRLALALERYEGAGMSKLAMLEVLQEYMKCVKEIAMTTTFEVKESKTLRKLAVGELLEVLERGRVDSASSLSRVKCRALTDGLVGWSSVRGNQGTAFLEATCKPYYCAAAEGALSSEFLADSPEVRGLRPGEALELVEGPRKEPSVEIARVRGKAQKDGKTGWVSVKLPDGQDLLEPTKLLSCKTSIAITTTFDIGEGKAIRKLEPGEMLEALTEEQRDEKRNLFRLRVKASNDNQEGWMTIKGNQGTSYAEVNSKLRVLTADALLESRLASGSTLVRALEKGEAFEVLDAPKNEVREGRLRAKGRHLNDGSVGWFTVSPKTAQRWTPAYKCSASTVLHDGPDIAAAAALQKIDVGDALEALAPPVYQEAANLVRVHVRSSKDGKVGYATVRGDQGTVFLESVAADTGAAASVRSTSGKGK